MTNRRTDWIIGTNALVLVLRLQARKARRSVSEKRTVMEQQLEELRKSAGQGGGGETKKLNNRELQEEMAALRASAGGPSAEL